jgi:hypothetical protein
MDRWVEKSIDKDHIGDILDIYMYRFNIISPSSLSAVMPGSW